MKQIWQNERGMALAIAIVALVIVGALVAGALFSGTQEQRVAENTRRVAASFGVAEEGVNEVIRVWPNSTMTFDAMGWYPATAPASSRAWGLTATQSNTGKFSGELYKLNNEIYFIDMTGQDQQSLAGGLRGGGASQRIGLLATIRPLQIKVDGALTSGGASVLAGNAFIDGNDHTPTGWTSCGPLGAPLAGVAIGKGDTVTANPMQIQGSPPVRKDTTIVDSTFSKFGDVTYWQLASRANITLPAQNFASSIAPATNASGQCDLTVQTNWGDPLNPTAPCGGYFPIIHITGSPALTIINLVEGQGILLVDGDLSVQGGFQWFGILIVKGSLKTAGGGTSQAHFWGTVMAQDTIAFGTDTTNNLTGHANLLYSKCAILRALDATGIVAIMRSRGWAQLF